MNATGVAVSGLLGVVLLIAAFGLWLFGELDQAQSAAVVGGALFLGALLLTPRR